MKAELEKLRESAQRLKEVLEYRDCVTRGSETEGLANLKLASAARMLTFAAEDLLRVAEAKGMFSEVAP